MYNETFRDLTDVFLQAICFIISSQIEKTKEEQAEAKDSKNDAAESVYHVKQSISNACGTIALLHSVANNLDV